MLIQRHSEAAVGAEEVVRYRFPQFCIISHSGPKLSGPGPGQNEQP
jgi:hypothetical protein